MLNIAQHFCCSLWQMRLFAFFISISVFLAPSPVISSSCLSLLRYKRCDEENIELPEQVEWIEWMDSWLDGRSLN